MRFLRRKRKDRVLYTILNDIEKSVKSLRAYLSRYEEKYQLGNTKKFLKEIGIGELERLIENFRNSRFELENDEKKRDIIYIFDSQKITGEPHNLDKYASDFIHDNTNKLGFSQEGGYRFCEKRSKELTKRLVEIYRYSAELRSLVNKHN